MATVFEQLLFSAMGGKKESRHGRKENKQITKLQDFLDEYKQG